MTAGTRRELIRNWEDLAKVKASENYRLKIEVGHCGWVLSKETGLAEFYLPSNTFNDPLYEDVTGVLQKYGFNVEIKSNGPSGR